MPTHCNMQLLIYLVLTPLYPALKLNYNNRELCADPEIDSLLAPVLKELLRGLEPQGLTVTPTAVSAIMALRYGGNTIMHQNKRLIFDHDVDLLLTGFPATMNLNPWTFWNSTSILRGYMLNKGFKFSSPAFPFGNFEPLREGPDALAGGMRKNSFQIKDQYGRTPGMTDAAGNRFDVDFFRVTLPPNELQLQFQRESQMLALQYATELVSIPRDVMNKSEQFVNFAGELMNPHVLASRPWVQFDIFGRMGPQKGLEPHPTKKIFLHGVAFPFHKDPSVVLSSLQMSFWDKQSVANKLAVKNNLCIFSKPGGNFKNDYPGTPENVDLVSKCSATLAAHGYESFHSCGPR